MKKFLFYILTIMMLMVDKVYADPIVDKKASKPCQLSFNSDELASLTDRQLIRFTVFVMLVDKTDGALNRSALRKRLLPEYMITRLPEGCK